MCQPRIARNRSVEKMKIIIPYSNKSIKVKDIENFKNQLNGNITFGKMIDSTSFTINVSPEKTSKWFGANYTFTIHLKDSTDIIPHKITTDNKVNYIFYFSVYIRSFIRT